MHLHWQSKNRCTLFMKPFLSKWVGFDDPAQVNATVTCQVRHTPISCFSEGEKRAPRNAHLIINKHQGMVRWKHKPWYMCFNWHQTKKKMSPACVCAVPQPQSGICSLEIKVCIFISVGAEEGREITARKLESRKEKCKDIPLICQKIRSSDVTCHRNSFVPNASFFLLVVEDYYRN